MNTTGWLALRQDARERVAHPGKFEGEDPMVAIIYDISLDGGADAETSVYGLGWACAVGRWTLYESDNGFVYGNRWPSANAAVEAIEAQDAEWNEEEEESD